MATVSLKKLSKRYGNTQVVHGIDLEVTDREFIALVGPSGCGKSTTLRMIAGLEEISDGLIEIGGRVVNDLPPRSRNISMVFQSYALYPHMTVRENLGYGLRVRRSGKAETRRRVDEVAGLLGLVDLLDRKPAQLSGGQRQRVAMGRAIVREPQAFLMDEPLSNLDAKLRVAMRASLAQLHAKLGVTTIYVTHDQTEAMTLGQRVAVMRDGHIVQFDEPQVLYRQPRDVFVAAFIGSPSMNLVEASIEGSSVRFGQFAVPLDPENRPRQDVGTVVLGIRPEAFEDGDTASPALPRVSADVEVLEELGAETHICFPVDAKRVSVDTGSDDAEDEASLLPDHAALFTARVDARTHAAQGATMSLAVDPARFHFFDAVSGASLATAGAPAPAVAEQWS